MAILNEYAMQMRVPMVSAPGWWRWLSIKFFAMSGRVKLFQKLARILRRPNANIVSVIEDLYERAYNKSRFDSTTIVLSEVLANLKAGKSVSASFAMFADPIEIMLLRGGELAGAGDGATEESRRTGLQRAIQKILILSENKRRTSRAVTSAYGTLALYVSMIIVSLMVLSDYVVPKIAVVFPPEHWEGIARSMYDVGQVVNTTGFAIFIILAMTILFGMPFTFPYWTGRMRDYLDKFPPFSFYRLQQGGGWLMSIPAITESGRLKAYDALVQTSQVATPWLKAHIDAISGRMESGSQFGAAMLESGDFPDSEIVADVRLYEKQGLDIDTVLKEIAAEWTETGVLMIQAQAKLLEQISLVMFAGVLVWFTLGTVVLQVQMPAYFMSMSGM